MIRLCVAIIAGSLSSAVYAEQTLLHIIVQQITHVRPEPQPFSAVGTFQVYRGEQTFAGASCPDLSNDQGRLTCTITCDKSDSLAKPLRVVPPSRSDRVRGYIAPPSASVELKGCALSPQAVSSFVYKDANLTLQRAIAQFPSLRNVITLAGGNADYQFAKVDEALPIMQQMASSPDGATTLISLNEAARALAMKYAKPDPQKAELLTTYNVGIQNVFLAEVAKNKFRIPDDFKITGNKTDYYKNLGLLEETLDRRVGRSTQETILLNDVQALKRQPIDPALNQKLYRYVTGGDRS